MRLISQDGKVDIPYENSVVYAQAIYDYNREKKCHDITGYKIITPIGDDTWNLGDYSTEEKALKVIEMLQQAYLGRNEALNLDMAEGAEEELLNIIKRQGFGTLHVFEKDRDPRVDFFPLHTYFKFPDDEEVET